MNERIALIEKILANVPLTTFDEWGTIENEFAKWWQGVGRAKHAQDFHKLLDHLPDLADDLMELADMLWMLGQVAVMDGPQDWARYPASTCLNTARDILIHAVAPIEAAHMALKHAEEDE